MFSYGQVKVALSAGVFFSAERRFVLCSMLTKRPYRTLRGVPRSLKRFLSTVSRFELLGICGTLRIVIPVENHPQKPKNRLADYIFCCACVHVLFLRLLLLYTLNLNPYTLPHLYPKPTAYGTRSLFSHDSYSYPLILLALYLIVVCLLFLTTHRNEPGGFKKIQT